MKFQELDVIRLKNDIPSEGLRRGDIGTIMLVFDLPNEAYEVEFSNPDGTFKALLTLRSYEMVKAKE